MNSQRVRLVTLCATLLLGTGSWLALKLEGRLKAENEALRKENNLLQQELTRFTSLARQEEPVAPPAPATNNAQPVQELLRLRGELGVLRQESKEVHSLREQNRLLQQALEKATALPASASTALFWSRESLAFVGRDSPESALKSFIWALTQGDLQTASACATGPQLEQIQAWIAHGEGQASPQIKAELGGLQSLSVRRRDVLTDDAVLLTVMINEAGEPMAQHLNDESLIQGSKFWMKKMAGEWKVSDFP